MKHLSQKLLSDIVTTQRGKLSFTQTQVAKEANINRAMLSRIENGTYTPTFEQLESLCRVLHFDIEDILVETGTSEDCNKNQATGKAASTKSYNIAVAGTGYVGLSLAVLLSQHNKVTAVDIIPEKVEKINKRISPIQDKEIEEYLANKNLDLTATLDAEKAYKNADFVIVAAPTNYDPQKNFFDTSAVENVIETVLKVNKKAAIIIKSTIPVGYTKSIQEKYNTNHILFSPEFLRESKALYDNLYPSRIIVGCDKNNKEFENAQVFAALLQEGAVKKT